MGHDELIDDPRCKNHGARLRIADELDAMVSEWTSAQPRDAMIEGLIEAGIPCAPVRTVEEVIADPEIAQRRMLIDSDYPTRGKIRVAGTPIKMSAAPDDDRPMRRPPELGEHTTEVLGSIGIGTDELESLKRAGVV
jgi:crotonobetainyl-CoA:carnitine CoA-transferase CaiB-like acyl-CoA transferase